MPRLRKRAILEAQARAAGTTPGIGRSVGPQAVARLDDLVGCQPVVEGQGVERTSSLGQAQDACRVELTSADMLAGVTPTTLLTARPLLALLDQLQQDHAVLRHLAPSSDAPAVLVVMRGRLAAALHEATRGDRWVSVAEAARILGRSESGVRQRIAAGKLRAEKRGKGYRIHVNELRNQ